MTEQLIIIMMKQFNWNHIDQTGKIHKVGLLHGNRTGHVLIHVNGKISTIDFKVLKTKQYSFFINEELIEINIVRHEDHFAYSMEINEEVKTPLNERRNKERTKMGFQTLAFFAVLMLIVGAASLWMTKSSWYKNRNAHQIKRLDHIGLFTKAKLFVDGNTTYYYEFVDRNQKLIRGSGNMPLNPIKSGDEYMVRYLPSDPSINKVFFGKPTEYQISRSVKEGLRVCQELENSKDEVKCKCTVASAVDAGGHSGLLAYINQSVTVGENALFNESVARQLMEGDRFKVALSACLE